MKNKKNFTRSIFFLACLFISMSGIIGCSNSDDNPDLNADCLNWSDQFTAQLNAYLLAAETYSTDPNLANCQNYKAAGLTYISALESVLDCIPIVDSQEYMDTLNAWIAEVNAIECN